MCKHTSGRWRSRVCLPGEDFQAPVTHQKLKRIRPYPRRDEEIARVGDGLATDASRAVRSRHVAVARVLASPSPSPPLPARRRHRHESIASDRTCPMPTSRCDRKRACSPSSAVRTLVGRTAIARRPHGHRSSTAPSSVALRSAKESRPGQRRRSVTSESGAAGAWAALPAHGLHCRRMGCTAGASARAQRGLRGQRRAASGRAPRGRRVQRGRRGLRRAARPAKGSAAGAGRGTQRGRRCRRRIGCAAGEEPAARAATGRLRGRARRGGTSSAQRGELSAC